MLIVGCVVLVAVLGLAGYWLWCFFKPMSRAEIVKCIAVLKRHEAVLAEERSTQWGDTPQRYRELMDIRAAIVSLAEQLEKMDDNVQER